MGDHRSVHVKVCRELSFAPALQRECNVQRFASDGRGTDRRADAFAFGPGDDATQSPIAHADVLQFRLGRRTV